MGYSEIELVTPGSGYQFIHAADMMYCADNHLKSGFSLWLHAHQQHTRSLLKHLVVVPFVLSDKDWRQWLHILQAADQNRTLVVGSGVCQDSLQSRETRFHHSSSESLTVSISLCKTLSLKTNDHTQTTFCLLNLHKMEIHL